MAFNSFCTRLRPKSRNQRRQRAAISGAKEPHHQAADQAADQTAIQTADQLRQGAAISSAVPPALNSTRASQTSTRFTAVSATAPTQVWTVPAPVQYRLRRHIPSFALASLHSWPTRGQLVATCWPRVLFTAITGSLLPAGAPRWRRNEKVSRFHRLNALNQMSSDMQQLGGKSPAAHPKVARSVICNSKIGNAILNSGHPM